MTKYVIINSNEVNSVDFSQVLETSAQTLRHSIDEAFCVLKYTGDQPSFLEGKTVYSHSEIIATMAGPEWTAGITGSP